MTVKITDLKVGMVVELTTRLTVTSATHEGVYVKREDIGLSNIWMSSAAEGPHRTIKIISQPARQLKRGDVLVFREDYHNPLVSVKETIKVYGWRVQLDGGEVALMSDMDVRRTYTRTNGGLEHWLHEGGSEVRVEKGFD